MEDFLLVNGVMDDIKYFKIYQESCYKISHNLQGAVLHPGLILHLLLFNTGTVPIESIEISKA